ncbi:M91 family zinc metallopeptidase [Aquimarina longa]|uniref:M91 family zinc metallopeptidase n=1 Tax=Aquimarina longa TaxID=1080221 RepID=UPI0007827780|nr:M91 family zinc metallopeptidase [Aquimarina longa]
MILKVRNRKVTIDKKNIDFFHLIICYIYHATGAKLKKIATEGGSLTETVYAGNYVYKNGNLEFFNHPEGIVEKEADGYKYVYQYKDHLGNIRLSYKDANKDGSITQSEIVEEKNYYPYGLEHKGYNNTVSAHGNSTAQKKGFANEELEEELDKNTIAYQWRDYDPAIARFNKIDRFSEKYENLTPYHYGANNPMYYVDIQGDSLWIRHKGNDILYQNGGVYNKDGTEYTGKGVKTNKDGTTELKGFLKKTVNALTAIANSAEGASMISELESSDNNFTIVNAKTSQFNNSDSYKAFANQWRTDPAQAASYAAIQNGGRDFSGGAGGTIHWNPSGAPLVTLSGTRTNGTTDLAHEMFHALDSNRGLLDSRVHNGLKRSEWQATYRENVLRTQLGLPIRSHYKTSLNAATGARSGLPPRMLSPAPTNSPILPSWYTN